MSENKLSEIIAAALENVKEVADVQTVIGDPISTPSGVTIIPVSKVSLGFASGGLDFAGKDLKEKPAKGSNSGTAGGTGVTVSPLGFLVIQPDGTTELLNVAFPTGPAAAPDLIESVTSLLERSPEIISRLKGVFSKKKDKAVPEDASEKAAERETEPASEEEKTEETDGAENA